MRKKNLKKLILTAAVLALLALSCSELTVENNTSNSVRILVTMPGEGGPETILLSEGDPNLSSATIRGLIPSPLC